jgi:hypothetical protein
LPRSSIASRRGAAPAQQRHLDLRFAHGLHCRRRRRERVGDRTQIARRERDAPCRRLDRLVDLIDALHREPGVLYERTHLRGLANQLPHDLEIRHRLASDRTRIRTRRMRPSRIALPNALKIENLEPPLVDERNRLGRPAELHYYSLLPCLRPCRTGALIGAGIIS